jgi:sigma-B regulation protein RsbU (phosphoserine phosphatase)
MGEPEGAEDRLHRIEAVTDTALSHLDLDALLRELLDRIRELLDVDTAAVLLHDQVSHHLVATAAVGLEEEVRQGVRVALGEGFAGQVAGRREPVILDRVDETTVINPLLWEKGLRSLLGVPMLAGGELIGVLHIGSVMQREFTESDVRLLQLVADRIALAAQVQLSSAERAAATALQHSLLPATLPSVSGLQFAARYVPGADLGVGGDWYDVFPLPGDRVGIVIGDVVGHGLASAVVMGRLRSALRAYALDEDDPSVVLTKLDRKATHFEHGVMATVLYAIVSPSRESFHLSLAGHLAPVQVGPEEAGRVLTAPADPPIGIGFASRHRTSSHVPVPRGSMTLFYTDGLVERRGEDIDAGFARLCRAADTSPPEVVCARIMSALVGADAVRDDIALLAMRRT